MVNLPHKNSKLLLFENFSNKKSNENNINTNNNITEKNQRQIQEATTTNTVLLVTYNDHKPLTDIANSSILHAVWVLYEPLKQLIHHLT